MFPNLENLEASPLEEGQPAFLGPVSSREEVHHGEVATRLGPRGAQRGHAVVADEQLGVSLFHGGRDVLEDPACVRVVPVV